MRNPETGRSHNSRRVAVLCVLCKTEKTNRTSGVCYDCESKYLIGVAYAAWLKRQAESSEDIIARLPNNPSLDPSLAMTWEEVRAKYGERIQYSATSALASAILGFAEVEPVPFTRADESYLYGPKGITDYRDQSYFRGKRSTFERLVRVFDLARFALAEQYRKGYKDGGNMLVKLAAGDLTVNDLTKIEIEKGS